MQGIESLGYEVRDQPLVPDGGMQQLKGAADLLAEFGRNGDTYVVHAAEGETVLPMEVLESSPKLKKMIYAQMQELGLQPERYVIGNELNSLNPVTGQPEFFFKKLFKKIKKVGKKVISLAKKVAPIILPLALPFLLPVGVPLFLSAGIGSLAGNLIAGNSFKDSLKSAAITAVTAGVGSAVSSGSLSGFTNDASGITSKLGEFFGQAPTPVSPNLATASGEFGGSAFGGSASPITNEVFAGLGVEDIGLGVENIGLGVEDIGLNTATSNQIASMDPFFSGVNPGPVQVGPNNAGNFLTNQAQMRAASPNLTDFQSIMDQAQFAPPPPAEVTLGQTLNSTAPDFVTASGGNPASLGRGLGQPMLPNELNTTGIIPRENLGIYSPDMSNAQVGGIDPNVSPNPSFLDDPIQGLKDLYGNYLSPSRPGVDPDAGILTKYGPLLATGGAGILAADALFPPEEQERLQLGDGRTGQDLLDEDIASGRYEYGFNPRMFYGNNPYYQRGQFTQARQGGEIDGPGTGTSDSIPAMLSDGEFVMTAKAVRGAGGNDRQAGAKRMYAMMRQFENEAAA